jgi:uncharacterized protein
MKPVSLSRAEARRVALAAQGFPRPRAKKAPGVADLARTIRALGLLQLDYVNVLVPAHYLVLFSRLGPWDVRLLDELYRTRAFTEHWAHEASLVPVETWPLLRYRRESHRVRPYGFESFLAKHEEYVSWVLEEVRARGPLAASELPHPEGVPRRMAEAWFKSVPRAVLEAHFGRGKLAVHGRRANFARTFDLVERVLPAAHHAREVIREEAQRALLLVAARAHGVGTTADLADYFRMPVRLARPLVAELAASGALHEARIEGARESAFMYPDAALPRRIGASSLLSPFDPVVWFRPRALRLFGFDYRIEIFVPEALRKFGYYVLPFLLGDQLAARVDLKSDRPARTLRVLSSHLEAGSDPEAVADALAAELRTLSAWLGLDQVKVGRRGTLAAPLAAALRA